MTVLEYMGIGLAVLYILVCLAATFINTDGTGWRKKSE